MLSAIVDELRPALAGHPFADVVQLETHRFLLRFDEPPFPRLHVAVHPGLSTLHLARGLKAPAGPTELAVAMTRPLQGRRLAEVVHPAGERLIRLVFDDGQSVVAELMGKASNLLLLDPQGRMVRFAHSHEGEFRRPREGAPWEPPPPSSRWTAPPADRLDEAGLRGLAARASGEGGPGLAGVLASSVPGFSALMAREVEHLASQGVDPWRAFDDVRRMAVSPDARRPVVHAPAPLDQLAEGEPLGARRLFAFPWALRHALDAGLSATPFPTMNEAEAAATGTVLRGMACAALRQSLGGMLRQEAKRARELATALQRELEEAEASAVRDRRRGELILAGLHAARKEAGRVRVPDVYEPGAPPVDIPIDPRLDLRANAERYFKEARRSDRARGVIPGRLKGARDRLDRIEHGLAGLQEASTRAELQALESRLLEEGIVRAVRRATRTEMGEAAPWVPVREFITAEGFTIMVGRSAADNDHITFHVAAPHDLWLHAAGQPGAHVIVRNPRRLRELPEPTVLIAAALAAWMSRGKEEKELDVHVAWRRDVRKGRGMSPGMVMLRRHRTVRVSPALPRSPGQPGPPGSAKPR